MANEVVVIEAEYTDLKSGLSDLHQDSLDLVKTIITKLQAINGGAFCSVVITPKVDALIAEIEAAKASMESVYEEDEAIIESFETVIAGYDSLG